jgi:hypothetical protein
MKSLPTVEHLGIPLLEPSRFTGFLAATEHHGFHRYVFDTDEHRNAFVKAWQEREAEGNRDMIFLCKVESDFKLVCLSG